MIIAIAILFGIVFLLSFHIYIIEKRISNLWEFVRIIERELSELKRFKIDE